LSAYCCRDGKSGYCVESRRCGRIFFALNPLSTKDGIAAFLVKHHNIPIFAVKGENNETYYKHINAVLDIKLQITME
jgi:S-adenosylhomocysteine hydrolase